VVQLGKPFGLWARSKRHFPTKGKCIARWSPHWVDR